MVSTGLLLAVTGWTFNLVRSVFYLLGIVCMVKFLARHR